MPPAVRRMFWFLNKFFMVPLFRLGLGFLFGNPFSGYIMVLKAVGRKSGKTHYAPVNYAIYQGEVYCISGGRQSSDWYKNLLANPRIEVILPAGPIFGVVEEVSDAGERRMLIREVLQNAGFAGFFEGYNPFTISDEDLVSKTADLPLLRIHPIGIGSGASDPRGWAWIWSLMLMVWIVWVLIK